MQVTCPACSKTSNANTDVSGKSVKCTCGQSFVVPKAGAQLTQSASQMAPISVQCECGKAFRAPATAAGKAIKCTCGKLIKVPLAQAKSVAPAVSNASSKRQTQPPHAAPVSTPFHALSDADWANLAPKPPPEPDPFAPPKKESATSAMLNQARADMGQAKKAVRSGAGGHLASSRWILIGIGALKLGLCIFQLVVANATATALAEGSEDIGVDEILVVIQVIAGFGIATSVLFILMGIFVFLLPLTCTISALVLFVLLELISFVFNPFLLVNIRAWIIRGAMFGALVQAINNAAYFKFVKTGGRD